VTVSNGSVLGKVCRIEGCERAFYAKGVCNTHYAAARRHAAGAVPRGPNTHTIDGDTTWLVLTARDGVEKARTAIDTADLRLVLFAGVRWSAATGNRHTLYVKSTRGMLHRFLLGLPKGRHPQVDHFDGDGLNNRRGNLFTVTPSENLQNQRARSSTGFRNVYFEGGRYRVRVTCEGKRYEGGSYPSAEEANVAAVELRARIFTHVNEERL